MLRIDYIDIDEIQSAPINPKLHDKPLIARSMQRHGMVEVPTIDERTGRLVAGHGRVETLRERKASGAEPPERVEVRDGKWFIPVLKGYRSDSDLDAADYLLVSNTSTMSYGFDLQELQQIIVEAQEHSYELTSWPEQDLSAITEYADVNEDAPTTTRSAHNRISLVVDNETHRRWQDLCDRHDSPVAAFKAAVLSCELPLLQEHSDAPLDSADAATEPPPAS